MKTLPLIRDAEDSCGVARTCRGSCCAAFTWPIDYDPSKTQDGPMIADMLIRLTPEEADERSQKFGAHMHDHAALAASGRSACTCRHWDEETRLCTVYDRRPTMCRNYPYAGACEHGCDYVAPEGIQAAYRLNRLVNTLATKEEQYDVIVGDPRADVHVHAHKINIRTGRSRCGLSLTRGRVVRRTKRIVACKRCWPEVYAK